MLPAGLDEAALDPKQRRCLAVLRGGRAGEELAAAAKAILARAAAPQRPPPKAPKAPGWLCAACSLHNPKSSAICQACTQPRVTAEGWPCPACTLQNAAGALSCATCGQGCPQPGGRPGKKARRAQPQPMPAGLSDEDDFK